MQKNRSFDNLTNFYRDYKNQANTGVARSSRERIPMSSSKETSKTWVEANVQTGSKKELKLPGAQARKSPQLQFKSRASQDYNLKKQEANNNNNSKMESILRSGIDSLKNVAEYSTQEVGYGGPSTIG